MRKRASTLRRYCSTALDILWKKTSQDKRRIGTGRQKDGRTFERCVKNRASWYSSAHSRSCRKLIGLRRESNKSTIDEL